MIRNQRMLSCIFEGSSKYVMNFARARNGLVPAVLKRPSALVWDSKCRRRTVPKPTEYGGGIAFKRTFSSSENNRFVAWYARRTAGRGTNQRSDSQDEATRSAILEKVMKGRQPSDLMLRCKGLSSFQLFLYSFRFQVQYLIPMVRHF